METQPQGPMEAAPQFHPAFESDDRKKASDEFFKKNPEAGQDTAEQETSH